ncbi:MAG: hypothetical protein JST66_08990 [Bacteroidetes bacterium]|nr:hypothetical protein [Bacteroidota bacterium]
MAASQPPPLVPQEPDMHAHPHAPDDTPAARGILGIVLVLLVVCSVIAVLIYSAYREPEHRAPVTEPPAATPTR